ncbi:MAG: rRNA pseudouridine synthase [Clostridiales bacterium]|nr:rRNA pseudouridine synthase [Clostridiales bacterium]
MRLQKYIAQCGIASRRKAEEMIAQGKVQVNGKTVTQMGILVEPDDEVRVEGKIVLLEEEKHYVLYHKPMGEVTTVSDPKGRDTVLDKFQEYPVRLFPVGRLDYNSEGLLLLTNDGALMQRMLHPSQEVDKVYLARVTQEFTQQDAITLMKGVWIDGQRTSPAKVRIIKKETFATVILITIHEGRNRQVRKMVESSGHKVLLLRRVQFGPLQLGDLPRGKWRHLTPQEIEKLQKL